VGSNEVENIRKNILAELTDLLTKLKKELQVVKSRITGDYSQRMYEENRPAFNYKLMNVTEEFLLKDIHQKLNDIDIATQLTLEIG